MALFDYSGVKTFEATLQVDDPGNCAIKASGYFQVAKGVQFPCDYFIIISTIMGQTTVLKWGPCQNDIPALPNGFGLDVKSFKFKESSINREITLFLNDGFKSIYEAEVVSMDEALEYLPNIDNFVATLT